MKLLVESLIKGRLLTVHDEGADSGPRHLRRKTALGCDLIQPRS